MMKTSIIAFLLLHTILLHPLIVARQLIEFGECISFHLLVLISSIQVLAFDAVGMLIILQTEKVASGMKLPTLRAMMGAMAGFGCLQ
jgi:hypothetical protein